MKYETNEICILVKEYKLETDEESIFSGAVVCNGIIEFILPTTICSATMFGSILADKIESSLNTFIDLAKPWSAIAAMKGYHYKEVFNLANTRISVAELAALCGKEQDDPGEQGKIYDEI